MVKYIHYGNNEFDINKFNPIKNIKGFTKPSGGLWASRTTATYGYKELAINDGICSDEYINSTFEFSLKDKSNIVYLRTISDIENLPCLDVKRSPFSDIKYEIDFEKCLEDGIDAIELIDQSSLYYALYGWDCESILILNPEIIEPM